MKTATLTMEFVHFDDLSEEVKERLISYMVGFLSMQFTQAADLKDLKAEALEYVNYHYYTPDGEHRLDDLVDNSSNLSYKES